jgi:hypothetical protein
MIANVQTMLCPESASTGLNPVTGGQQFRKVELAKWIVIALAQVLRHTEGGDIPGKPTDEALKLTTVGQGKSCTGLPGDLRHLRRIVTCRSHAGFCFDQPAASQRQGKEHP